MEYCSAIKKNEIELCVVRWMDLETVIQSEVKSEREKQTPYANTYMESKKKMVLKNLGTDRRRRDRQEEEGQTGDRKSVV